MADKKPRTVFKAAKPKTKKPRKRRSTGGGGKSNAWRVYIASNAPIPW